MPIPVVCPCSAKLKVGDHLQGKQIKCPKCGSLIAVGAPNGVAPASAAKTPAKPATPAKVLEKSRLSEDERDAVKGELEKDEHVLWAGKPVADVARKRGWLMSVAAFSVAFVGLVIVVIFLAVGFVKGGVDGLLMIAIPGLLLLGGVGAGLMMPKLAQRKAERSFYALTTRRALTWEATWFKGPQLQTYDAADLLRMYRTPITRDDRDVGNLIFGARATTRKTTQGTVQTGVQHYGFFYVPGSSEVERILREYLIDPLHDKLYE